MKHNLKITIILLVMFLVTQLLGLYITNYYSTNPDQVPYGFGNVPEQEKTPDFYSTVLFSFITSFIFAIILIFLLMRIKSRIILRIWFFTVITLALGITLSVFMFKLKINYAIYVALAIALILAIFKVFRRNILIHNITEIMIYPGVAAIFVAILNLPIAIIVLLLISIYDIWAVWHSGVMQKMAKFQINSLGIFGGFFVPYANKKIKQKIKLLKLKYKNNIPKSVIKKSNLKINLAILGGGDIVFPIVAAGVFLKTFNSLAASLCVTLFATLSLAYLLLFSQKKKFYPAMPYLTAGILLGMLVGWLVFVL